MPIGLVVNPDAAVDKPFAGIEEVYPNLDKEYDKLRKKIRKSAKKKSGLCHGFVNYVYISQKIKKNPYLLFSLDDEGELDGFALISKFDDGTIRVYLLCSLPGTRGIGSKLHKAIEQIAAFVGVRKLVVKSLPNSMSFYEHLGYSLDLDVPFEDTEPEDEDVEVDEDDEFPEIAYVPMSKLLVPIVEAGQGAGKKGGSRTIRRKRRQTRKLR